MKARAYGLDVAMGESVKSTAIQKFLLWAIGSQELFPWMEEELKNGFGGKKMSSVLEIWSLNSF